MRPFDAFVLLWLGWGLSWALAAFWSSAAEAEAPRGEELRSRLLLYAGGVLFAIPAHGSPLSHRLWLVGWAAAWACAALVALGIALAWWARLHLGRLWSAGVARKAEHRVVDSGPYGIVRHPIYTGLLLAVLATLAVKGTLLGLAGAALIVVGIWLKARLEERFLRAELGPGTYDAYAARVGMLVPGIG